MSMRKAQWKAPNVGWIKVNVDGAFVEQTGQAGAGVVARNHVGKTIFTAWRVLFRCSSAVETEMLACLEGLRLAAEWAHGPVTLEGKKQDRSEIGNLVAEARGITRLLQAVEFVQVKRWGL
ncbi:hypothetical protein PR202_ga25666 [Eleusine coracana subsp. coracana]|uniref:RNase H type-1 domain-containing protein n=1 Tax=Eleusine coracana subsp. coracana TaxID=191504 RepID=A0AAV5DBB4_ELECO|nr:hypothetical protein PR202_ga25666 [Eleusine coracana subsp. coracana]